MSKRQKLPSLEYLAGFFDGEGAVGIFKQTDNRRINKSYQVYCAIGQVSENSSILYLLQEKYGGKIQFTAVKGNRKECLRWMIVAHKALAFLKDIEPYLIIKKERALLCIEYGEIIHQRTHNYVKGKRFTNLSREEWDNREMFYQKLKKLNQRGIVQNDGVKENVETVSEPKQQT